MNLFKKKNNLETEQAFKKQASVLAVSNDDTKWNKELISEFLSQYPILQNSPINIVWKKKDKNKGYAVGSILILGGAVPVVIENFKAYPFDMILFPGRVIPLDKYSIAELTSSDSPFAGAANGDSKDSLSLFGDKELQLTPNDSISGGGQNQANYTRPSVKVASFIDRISNFSHNDVNALLTSIKTDECTKILENGEELNKIAEKVVNYDKEWVNVFKTAEIDRQYVYQDENGDYFVKQAFSGIDYTKITKINDEERQNLENLYAEQEKVAEKSENIEFVAFDEIKVGTSGKEGQFIDTFGNTTPKMDILEIKKVAELVDYVILPIKDSNKSIVFNNRGSYYVADRKVSKARNIDSLWKFVNTKPNVGDLGVWVINGVASEPFRIDKITPDLSEPGKFVIKADTNGFYKEFCLIPTNLSGLELVKNTLNKYWVPGNAVFVRLEEKMDILDNDVVKMINNSADMGSYYKVSALQNFSPVEYIIKEAEKIDGNIIPLDAFFGIEKKANAVIEDAPHIVYRDFGGFYQFFGPEFNKYASNNHNIHNLGKDEIVWPLIQLGVSENKIDDILNMYPGDEIKIANNLSAPITVEQFQSKVKQEFEKTASNVTEIKKLEVTPEMIEKLAEAYSDYTTVDAILSLGLINKFNIKEYLALIPDYERVLSELARLLLFSRLTNLNFKSETLENTVSSFNEVLHGLKGLREVTMYDRTTLQSTL